MGIDAYVLRYDVSNSGFAELFLSSPDFDLETLKRIAEQIGIYVGAMRRPTLIGNIVEKLRNDRNGNVEQAIIESLTSRKREWVSIKSGRVSKFPQLNNANELITNQGKPEWYGPVTNPNDAGIKWYIRPVFIPHQEINESTKKLEKVFIRWLCFARIDKSTISLHWKGFSFADPTQERENAASIRNSQFQYWRYIPDLFKELEISTQAKVAHINYHQLFLHELLDKFEEDSEFVWTHKRVRAEFSGISLNAHAGTVFDFDAGGLTKLASVIQESVAGELQQHQRVQIPQPTRVTKAILRTLIRSLGTLSYEFSLEKNNNLIFRAHTYFGQKEGSDTPDCLPHMRCVITQRNDLEQLQFVLAYHRMLAEDTVNEDPKPQTLPLF